CTSYENTRDGGATPPEVSSASPALTTFRINTCISVASKRLYLPLESTLMKKPGEGGTRHHSRHHSLQVRVGKHVITNDRCKLVASRNKLAECPSSRRKEVEVPRGKTVFAVRPLEI